MNEILFAAHQSCLQQGRGIYSLGKLSIPEKAVSTEEGYLWLGKAYLAMGIGNILSHLNTDLEVRTTFIYFAHTHLV